MNEEEKLPYQDINPKEVFKQTHVVYSVTPEGVSGCATTTGITINGKDVTTEEEFLNIKREEYLKRILDNDDKE